MPAAGRWGLAAIATMALAGSAFAGPGDFRPFDEVAKGYEKVISTADGAQSLYTVWVDRKKNQMLAELPRGWERQKHLIAVTQSSGGIFAGLQGPTRYVYWKRYDKRVALIQPELNTRSNGEQQSKDSVNRLFTDRVLIDVPIVTMGPSGQPVIDLDDLLVARSSTFVGGGRGMFGGGGGGGGVNARLAEVVSAKAFPKNIEIGVRVPRGSGQFVSYHYSISNVPGKNGYKPREADERIGYFTTVYRDLGQYDEQKKWVRYINRWHFEKRDAKLKLSPPKEPLVYYVEHTVPVRYRRWLRQGVEYWNDAFRTVGLDNAIEVYYQDAATGAHMEKDPEDVRYNFIRWLNNDISTAIGPHRSHPLTGQILDADVVLTDGWIRAYWGWYHEQAPELAMESFGTETMAWLEENPQWDPRYLLADGGQREQFLLERNERRRRIAAGEEVMEWPQDHALLVNHEHRAISDAMGCDNHHCMAAHGLGFHMAFGRLNLEAMGLMDGEMMGPDVETLDGIPEWFVGPLLSELVCHEVGHTLGLRHNFKASSIYTLEQINSEEWKGKKPLAGSVMDYLPPNFNMEAGEIQGDFAMIAIGPYDHWAIEYGYTFDDPKKVLERVADPELVYLTDDDTGGPDPYARRYDFAQDTLGYGENIMRIVRKHREGILDKFVKEGQSWSNARRGYQVGLSMQMRMLSMMSNWIGGAHVNRDRKGDPDGRIPIEVTCSTKQREAIEFLIENSFSDEAFGLTPELLAHMTVDKWSDQSQGDRGDPTWPVHARIMGIQASSLTMIMNPSTLQRVYDNEYRTPEDEDVLTLPELMQRVFDAVYGELDGELNGATFTDRKPMISSLRRNLQSTATDRLIALANGDRAMPRPIRTLAMHHLRVLNDKLDGVIEKRDGGQVDAYTMAHLEDLQDRVTKALNRIYVTNM